MTRVAARASAVCRYLRCIMRVVSHTRAYDHYIIIFCITRITRTNRVRSLQISRTRRAVCVNSLRV
jgi:hypothetical protein